jgi:hypothetical protein
MYSAPACSMSRPPTSALPARTASTTRSMEMPVAASRTGSTSTWYCFWKPPKPATSATPGTLCSQVRSFQSWKARSSARSCVPLLSASAYWYTQPTPVASGPSSVCTPSGSCGTILERYSLTRLRAQYGSVPSSKITYTYEKPKSEKPRMAFTRGAPSSADTIG